jgi:hypothetical protein
MQIHKQRDLPEMGTRRQTSVNKVAIAFETYLNNKNATGIDVLQSR